MAYATRAPRQADRGNEAFPYPIAHEPREEFIQLSPRHKESTGIAGNPYDVGRGSRGRL